MARDDIQREVLPIPDRPYAGPIVYEAKDPAAKYPPITPLRPVEADIVDAACTTDSEGNLHALVLADNGGLWYTVRAALKQQGHPGHQAGDWHPLEDLRQPQKPAANIRKIDAVGAVTDGMTLFVLVATEDQKLQRAIRKPDGPDIFKGKWTEPFKQIKPGGVFPGPLTAPFTVLVGAHFKKP